MDGSEISPKFKKWIKDGRGSGTGDEYKPWLTVRDLPSKGRSHRIWGSRTHRSHELLSDLELSVFLQFDWKESVTDIREQFPLKLDDTLEIAKKTGIRHPQHRGNVQIMSTDFLVDNTKLENKTFAIQVKTSSDMFNRRTIEKLELERRYWAKKEIPWFLITERHIPKTVVNNINWLYPAQYDERITDDLFELGLVYSEIFRKHPNTGISSIAMMLDQQYSFNIGESLANLRALMACRYFCFDLRVSWSELTVKELQTTNYPELMREQYAANQ